MYNQDFIHKVKFTPVDRAGAQAIQHKDSIYIFRIYIQ